jgi:hypothetical protein
MLPQWQWRAACCAARVYEGAAGHWSNRIGALLSIGTLGDDHDDRPDRGPVELSAEATVLRMLLGAQLRRLREAADISAEKAGYEIRDIEDLLTLYSVTDPQERSQILDLARQSSTPDWWTKYGDLLPGWFESYLGLESAAETIRSFQVQFIPGLFQTEDYARAITRLGHQAAPAEEIERRVTLRLQRQELLTRPVPPRVWMIMDEAVLRRPYGGPDVMRAQLRHLLDTARLPHVTLQVVPFYHGGHAAASGSFSILRFAERDLPDIVYIEQLTSAVYLDQRPDVEHYLEVVHRLSGEALTPAATIRFIEQVIGET